MKWGFLKLKSTKCIEDKHSKLEPNDYKFDISADNLDKSFEMFELEGDITFFGKNRRLLLQWPKLKNAKMR